MTEGRLGEFVARKVNLEEYLQPWITAGYVVSDESMDKLSRIDGLWDKNGNPLPEKIQFLRSEKTLTVVPRQDVTSEEYEKIAEELQKGQEAQQEAQALRQKNSELEQRLSAAEQELKGADEAIGGKKKALTQLEQELEQKGSELFAQKEDLKKEIAELEKSQAQIKKDVSTLSSEKERLTAQRDTARQSKNRLDKDIAFLGARAGPLKEEVADAEKKLTDLQDSYKQEEARVQQNLRDLHDSEDEIGKEIDSKKEELEKVDAEIVSKKKELESVGSEIDGKKKEVNSLQERAKEIKSLEEMQESIEKKEFTIQKMLHSVLPEADPSKKESVVAFYNAVADLFAKLDEVSAYVLVDEHSSEEQVINGKPKSKVDSYVGLLDRMKAVYENITAEAKTAAGLKQRADAARNAASSEDIQDEEVQASAVLDEIAEEYSTTEQHREQAAEYLLAGILFAANEGQAAADKMGQHSSQYFFDTLQTHTSELQNFESLIGTDNTFFLLSVISELADEQNDRESAIYFANKAAEYSRNKCPEKTSQAENKLRIYQNKE